MSGNLRLPDFRSHFYADLLKTRGGPCGHRRLLKQNVEPTATKQKPLRRST